MELIWGIISGVVAAVGLVTAYCLLKAMKDEDAED